MSTDVKLALKVISGPDEGKIFLLPDTCFVGRLHHCEIHLSDPLIAPMHARIGRRGGAYTITDMTAKPEIRVNRHVIMSRRLALGDVISIANTTFKVMDEDLARQEMDASHSSRPPASGITVMTSERDPVAGKTADLMMESKIATMPRPATRKLKNKLAPAVSPATAPVPREPGAGSTEELDAASAGDAPPPEEPPHLAVPDDSQFLKYRAVSMIEQDHRAARTSRIGWAIALSILVLLGAGFFYLRSQARHTRLVAQFRAAEEFVVQNPEKYDEAIERYRQLRLQAQGMNSRIDEEVVRRIMALEQDKEEKRKQFDTLLSQLDRQSQELAAADQFDEALAVYEQYAEPRLRDRIMAARKVAIQDIRNLRETRGAEIKERAAREDEVQKAASEQRAREKLKKMLDGVVDSMIAGQDDDAIQQFRAILADPDLASVKPQVEVALSTAEVLASTDKKLQALQGEGGEGSAQSGRGIFPNKANVALVEDLHSTLKAVYAIRKDDLLVAQGFLKEASGHLLSDSLLARARLSDAELAQEKAAIQACGTIWRRIVKESVDKIPTPTDCVTRLRTMAPERDRKELLAALGELENAGEQYSSTRFARKYAELFSAAKELKAGLALAGEASGFGDGKIIQIEGNQYFVELPEAQLDLQERLVGLFREKTLFIAPGKTTPIMARVDVHSVHPCRLLSDRQATFTLVPSTNVPSPVVGDKVLIGKSLRTGETYLGGEDAAAGSVLFSSTFSDKLEKQWESNGRNMRIENGRLSLDPRKDRRVGGQADLVLKMALGTEPIRVEFTLIDEESQGITVGLGGVEFVAGGQGGQRNGIYVRGSLNEPMQMNRTSGKVVQQISASRLRRSARLGVNKQSIECGIPGNVSTSAVDGVRFYSDGRFSIDDIKVERVVGGGDARIMAHSIDRREVLLSRGSESGWDSLGRGQVVYFFSRKNPDVYERQASGRVEAVTPAGLICSITDNPMLPLDSIGFLTPQVASAPRATRDDGPVPVASARAGQASVLYGTVKEQDSAGKVIVQLASAGQLPAKGFLAVVKDGIQSPHTREVLAVWCGEPVRCDMTMQDRMVICQLPAGVTLGGKADKGVVLSGTLIPAERKIDMEGIAVSFTRSTLAGASKFWELMNGKWRDKAGKLVSQPAFVDEGIPTLGMVEMFGGNAQFDLDVQIEKSGNAPETDWLRDVVVELYFPAHREAVAFGVGLGKDQDVQVTGPALNVKDGKMDRPTGLPAQAVVKVEKCCAKNGSLLRAGNEYSLRVRRVRDVVTFYINGKRLAYVRYPGLEGDAQLRLAAPRLPVTLGKASARELSATCTTPEAEPLLGEFGYVAWSDGSQVYFDSDIMGEAPGKTVTILAVDKVVQGEASTSVITRKAGTAMITDVGPRTSRATRLQGEPFEKGMKIFVGTFQSAPIFNDTRVRDVEQGL